MRRKPGSGVAAHQGWFQRVVDVDDPEPIPSGAHIVAAPDHESHIRVLFQGPGAWTVSRRFLDWLAVPEELRAELGLYQPDFGHVLVNLAELSMEQMGRDLMGRLTLSVMKAVAEGRGAV